MMKWFQTLLPREDRFFDMFEAHAGTLVSGADAMRKALNGGAETAKWCEQIVVDEHAADDIAREVLHAVRRSFITPFDRSDIRGLTNSLDDTIDQMQKTAKAITLYEVSDFAPKMQELADIAVQCAGLTLELTQKLHDMNRNQDRLNELTEQVTRLESQSDEVFDAGMKALFLAHRDGNAMNYIIGAEIYDHLEKVVDRFEDVANRVNGILVEHL